MKGLDDGVLIVSTLSIVVELGIGSSLPGSGSPLSRGLVWADSSPLPCMDGYRWSILVSGFSLIFFPLGGK